MANQLLRCSLKSDFFEVDNDKVQTYLSAIQTLYLSEPELFSMKIKITDYVSLNVTVKSDNVIKR